MIASQKKGGEMTTCRDIEFHSKKGQPTASYRWWYGQLSRIFGHAREPVMALRRHCDLLVLLLLVQILSHCNVSAFSKSELLFPFGEVAFDRSLVNETDDFNSVEVPLTTPVVFYDQVYTSIYVSQPLLFIFWCCSRSILYLILEIIQGPDWTLLLNYVYSLNTKGQREWLGVFFDGNC